MTKPTDPIKTSLRIPPDMHAELERAAAAAGLTLNAEMLIRLRQDPRSDVATKLLSEIEQRDAAMTAGLQKQLVAVWSVIERADGVLASVAEAMSQVKPGTEAADLKREVEFVRELIASSKAHR